MSRTTQSIGAAAGALLLAAGLTTATFAHGGRGGSGGPGEGRFMGRGLAQLNLTDAQRDQIRAIHETHRDELRQAGERLRAAHVAQREAAAAAPLDESGVRATSQALAEATTEMSLLRARVHQQVLSVLTPEQQERAKTLRAERESRLKDRDGRTGPGHGRSRRSR